MTPIWQQLGLQNPVKFRCRFPCLQSKGTGRTTRTICRAFELYAAGSDVIIILPTWKEMQRVSRIVFSYMPNVVISTTWFRRGTIQLWTDNWLKDLDNLTYHGSATMVVFDHSCKGGSGEVSVGFLVSQ